MDVDTYEEYQMMSGFSQDSANKYRAAADCCNRALHLLVQEIRQNFQHQTIGQLCAIGDSLARDQLKRVYTKHRVNEGNNDNKGLAYPTCISPNHLAAGYSPAAETLIYLQPGDLIKIEMAVHIDGYIASVTHTMLITDPLIAANALPPVTGPRANAVCAAYYASELIYRSLRPGVQSGHLLAIAQRVASTFHCRLMEGPLLTQTERFLLEAPVKCLRYSTDPVVMEQQRKQKSFTVEPHEVYTITVTMTTGPTGKSIQQLTCGPSGNQEPAITVFQRDVNTQYNLRTKSARALFATVVDRLGVFPFSERELNGDGDEALLRLGLKECLDRALLTGWPASGDKRGQMVAQFRHTYIVQDQLTTRITNTAGLPLPYVHSEFSLDSDLRDLISQPSAAVKTFPFNPAAATINQTAAAAVPMEMQ